MSNDQFDTLKSKKQELLDKLARYEKLADEAKFELQKVEIQIKEITEGRDIEAYKRAKNKVGTTSTLTAAEFFKLVEAEREKIELEQISKPKRGRAKGSKNKQKVDTTITTRDTLGKA